MQIAVREAALSRPEDERAHPKVGAVLADSEGRVLYTAHRGEVAGAHAEYLLLERANAAATDLADCVLLTTLEPCIHRGPGKIPCAERIAAAGLGAVYIGTLDPNPDITGRGEMYLSYTLPVDRFARPFVIELTQLNASFFELHRDAHVPAVSIYASHSPSPGSFFPKPALGRDRNKLLQQTLDLVSGDEGAILALGGDLSWYREAQVTFLGAALDGRSIRVLGHTNHDDAAFRKAMQAVCAIGGVVGRMAAGGPLRGTIVSPETDRAAMVLIDKGHASLFRSPDDEGLLGILAKHLEELWRGAQSEGGVRPQIVPIDEPTLIGALHEHVPAYQRAKIGSTKVAPDEVLPLTRHLERFKLFRVNRLAAIRARHGLPPSAVVRGSSWPFTPPVVEQSSQGLVVVDGSHRLYMALRRGDPDIDVLLVEHVEDALPADPVSSWDDVGVYNAKLPRHQRYAGYEPRLFRPIRDAFAQIAAATEN